MTVDSKLVIIEAPGKLRTLHDCFLSLYASAPVIVCTYGRLYDLPESEIGVDPHTHAIEQILPIRDKLPDRLKAEIAKHSQIYLMMDDDDEGEWIASQLARLARQAGAKSIYRCPLRSITGEDVKQAFENPRPFDFSAVYAAIARRVIDREIGYLFSRDPINVNGQYIPPAAVGRVVTPVLNHFCQQEEIVNYGLPGEEAKKPGLVSAYLIRDLPDIDGGPKWSAIVSCKAGINTAALADRLASLPSMPIRSVSSSIVDRGIPDGGEWLEIMSREMGVSVAESSMKLQKAYENGAISYHRSDSNRMSRAYRERLVRAGRKLGVNLDLSRLEGRDSTDRVTRLSDRGAHEAPIPLRPPIPGVPRDSLGDDDQVVSVMWGYLNIIAAQGEETEREYGEPVDSSLSDRWSKSLQGCSVLFVRESRLFPGGGSRKRSTMQAVDGKPLGEKLFSGVRLVKVPPDVRVLQVLRALGIGRPSTLANHAEKISREYFARDGSLNGKAGLAVSRARALVPELLDHQALNMIEQAIYQDAPGLKYDDRISQALNSSGLSSRWPELSPPQEDQAPEEHQSVPLTAKASETAAPRTQDGNSPGQT